VRVNNIIKDARLLAEKEPVIIAARFMDSHRAVQAELERQGIPFTPIDGFYSFGFGQQAPGISLMNAEHLTPAGSTPQPGSKVTVLVTEHHPLPEGDEEVRAFADSVSSATDVIFYVSLDEALLSVWGADRMRELLPKLGLHENEALSHPMITKSVQNAQEKIKTKATGNNRCGSQREWLQYNVPPGAFH